MNNVQKFKALHTQSTPLFIGNVWDINSALILENNGYQALGTSSAAIAESLGYTDGETMPFNELFQTINMIKSKTALPLTVDLEGGYSRNPHDIFNNIIALHNIGVVGVNIEDSIVTNGERTILNEHEFSKNIKVIKNDLAQKGIDIFINIRTDVYLLGLENPLEETLIRSKRYEESGADGIFVPCITNEQEINEIAKSISIPLNVMAVPHLPEFSKLQTLGVKRISSGPFLHNIINKHFNELLSSINHHQSFNSIFK